MTNQSRDFHRPILIRGELYASEVTPSATDGPRRYPRTYEEARDILIPEIQNTRELLAGMTADVAVQGTYIVCLRIGPQFTSKSNYPQTLLNQVGWTEIGSKRWMIQAHGVDNANETDETERTDGEQTQPEARPPVSVGKTLYVRGTLENLDQMERRLNQRSSNLTESW